MAELSINQLIKMILGVLVVVAVIIALYFAFKNKIIYFIQNLPGDTPQIILGLIKI